MTKESLSKLSPRVNQRTVVFQNPRRVDDHVFDDLLGGKDLAYLGGDATGEPWSGAERVLGVLLQVVFDWNDTSRKESFGFSLTVVLPDQEKYWWPGLGH